MDNKDDKSNKVPPKHEDCLILIDDLYEAAKTEATQNGKEEGEIDPCMLALMAAAEWIRAQSPKERGIATPFTGDKLKDSGSYKQVSGSIAIDGVDISENLRKAKNYQLEKKQIDNTILNAERHQLNVFPVLIQVLPSAGRNQTEYGFTVFSLSDAHKIAKRLAPTAIDALRKDLKHWVSDIRNTLSDIAPAISNLPKDADPSLRTEFAATTRQILDTVSETKQAIANLDSQTGSLLRKELAKSVGEVPNAVSALTTETKTLTTQVNVSLRHELEKQKQALLDSSAPILPAITALKDTIVTQLKTKTKLLLVLLVASALLLALSVASLLTSRETTTLSGFPVMTTPGAENRVYELIASDFYNNHVVKNALERRAHISSGHVKLANKEEVDEVWSMMVRYASRTFHATNIINPKKWPDEACKKQARSKAKIQRVMILIHGDKFHNEGLRELASDQIRLCGIESTNIRYFYLQEMREKYSEKIELIKDVDFVIADNELLLVIKKDTPGVVSGGILTINEDKLKAARTLFADIFATGEPHDTDEEKR